MYSFSSIEYIIYCLTVFHLKLLTFTDFFGLNPSDISSGAKCGINLGFALGRTACDLVISISCSLVKFT